MTAVGLYNSRSNNNSINWVWPCWIYLLDFYFTRWNWTSPE